MYPHDQVKNYWIKQCNCTQQDDPGTEPAIIYSFLSNSGSVFTYRSHTQQECRCALAIVQPIYPTNTADHLTSANGSADSHSKFSSSCSVANFYK